MGDDGATSGVRQEGVEPVLFQAQGQGQISSQSATKRSETAIIVRQPFLELW